MFEFLTDPSPQIAPTDTAPTTEGWGAMDFAKTLMPTLKKLCQLALEEKPKLLQGPFHGIKNTESHDGEVLWAVMTKCANVSKNWRDEVHDCKGHRRWWMPTMVMTVSYTKECLRECDDKCKTSMATGKDGRLTLMGLCGENSESSDIECRVFYDENDNQYPVKSMIGYGNPKIECDCGRNYWERRGSSGDALLRALAPPSLSSGLPNEWSVGLQLERMQFGNGNLYEGYNDTDDIGLESTTTPFRRYCAKASFGVSTTKEFLNALALECFRQSPGDIERFGTRSDFEHFQMMSQLYDLVHFHFGGHRYTTDSDDFEQQLVDQPDFVADSYGPFGSMVHPQDGITEQVFEIMLQIADTLQGSEKMPGSIERLRYWCYRVTGITEDAQIAVMGPYAEDVSLANLLFFAKTVKAAVTFCRAAQVQAIAEAAELADFRANKFSEEKRQQSMLHVNEVAIQGFNQEGTRLIKLVTNAVAATNKRVRELAEEATPSKKRQAKQ